MQALGNIEDEVPPFPAGELPGKAQAVADALDRVAEEPQGFFQGGDGSRRIELGHLFLGETLCQVVVSEIVNQSDRQRVTPSA